MLKYKDYTCKFRAFTLAEVLITLGIIGIVAAMTLPTLIGKIQEKQTVSRVISTYSILTQAIKLSEEKYGGISTWTNETSNRSKKATDVAEKLLPSLKISQDCGISDTNQNCVNNTVYLGRNGKPRREYFSNDVYKVILLNGSYVWWAYENGGLLFIYVDTNGKQPPNQWGKDLFMFIYNPNNDILEPSGETGGAFPYETDCKSLSSTGIGCAWWVIHNKNLDYK